MRKDVLLKFQIPLYISDGKIGRIHLNVHLWLDNNYLLKMPLNYKVNPSHMLVENIELTVTSIADGNNISN